MLYAKLIIIAYVLQEFQLQPISVQNQCASEDLLKIKRDNLDLLEESITSSRALSEQRLDEAKYRISHCIGSSTVALMKIDSIIADSSIQGECAQQLKSKIAIEKININLQQDKCVAKSKKNVITLESKLASSTNSFEFLKRKADFQLEKCAFKNGLLGCSAVANCSQQVVTQLISKSKSGADKTNNGIDKTVSDHTSCQSKVANKILALKTFLEAEVLECSSQESGSTESAESNESISSSETGKPTDSNNPSESNQPNSNESTESNQSDTTSNCIKPEKSNDASESNSVESAEVSSTAPKESSESNSVESAEVSSTAPKESSESNSVESAEVISTAPKESSESNESNESNTSSSPSGITASSGSKATEANDEITEGTVSNTQTSSETNQGEVVTSSESIETTSSDIEGTTLEEDQEIATEESENDDNNVIVKSSDNQNTQQNGDEPQTESHLKSVQ